MKTTEQKTNAKTSNAGMVAPVQKRSRQTLDRILSATESLLESKRFADLSMTEIAAKAKCAVGTMYGRFENKGALLDYIEERLIQKIVDDQHAFQKNHDWTKSGFEYRVKKLVEHIIKSYQSNRAILREVLERIHSGHAGPSVLTRKTMSEVFDRNVEFLIESISAKSRKQAKKVIALAMISVITVLQNRIVHGETSPISKAFPVSFFKSDLPKMVVGYVKEAGIQVQF